MLRHLPNGITLLRLLLAVPLGLLILRQEYAGALAIGAFAGLSDALDGWTARHFNAQSRLGAILDPVADKVLITTSFICFAQMQLIPWYLAIAVITRDIIIVSGAGLYQQFVRPIEFSATHLSKYNMCVQISFCVLVLAVQLLPDIPDASLLLGITAVLFFAAASGFDYLMTWTLKAIHFSDKHE